MYTNLHEVPQVVREIITALGTLMKVDYEQGDEYDGTSDDRSVASGLEDANAISSHTRWSTTQHLALLLDIDLESALLHSSNKPHKHLYVKLPKHISTTQLNKFLDAAADIGLIQEGYAEASKARGFTTLRLPWVKKEATNG